MAMDLSFGEIESKMSGQLNGGVGVVGDIATGCNIGRHAKQGLVKLKELGARSVA